MISFPPTRNINQYWVASDGDVVYTVYTVMTSNQMSDVASNMVQTALWNNVHEKFPTAEIQTEKNISIYTCHDVGSIEEIHRDAIALGFPDLVAPIFDGFLKFRVSDGSYTGGFDSLNNRIFYNNTIVLDIDEFSQILIDCIVRHVYSNAILKKIEEREFREQHAFDSLAMALGFV